MPSKNRVGGKMSEVTKEICKFIKEANFEDIPYASVKRMKTAVLDTIGCIIIGSTNTSGKAVMNYVKSVGVGKEESTVIGTKMKTSCMHACLINGTMGHRYEYDDGGTGGGHAGITIGPAALALGEKIEANGKDLLTAITIGYELMIRIRRAMERGTKLHALHPNCLAAFGAAAAACKLQKLDLETTTNAMGICGSIIPVFPREPAFGGTMTKDFYGGYPGYVGLMAVFLAQNGLTGQDNILEAKGGFYQLFAGGNFDENVLLDDLGKKYVWSERHCFKPHASCRGTHIAIDTAIKMFREKPINPDDVKQILVIGTTETCGMRGGKRPKTDIQAKFSIHYTVATALMYGHIDVDDFSEDKLRNPKILSLADKIKPLLDPAIPTFTKGRGHHRHGPIEIIVEFKDGGIRRSIVEDDRTLTEEEAIEKFKKNSNRIFPEKQTQKIVDTISKLEKIGNINELTKLLTP